MSSLAATQADGYYLPPEYFDSGTYKKQSKNQFAGSKGHNQYLQKGIVRFELPYKGICEGCQVSIGRGTRYNAHKVNTNETYFTTPIVEFQMTCRNCQHPWKIRTNPQERGFDYVEGIQIQAGQEDVVDMIGTDDTVVLSSLDRLESMAQGERKGQTEIEKLQALQQLQSQTVLEDATLNASIRATFRVDRKQKRIRQVQASQKGWRQGMELLNPSLEDTIAAKTAIYGQAHTIESKNFRKVRKSSIFDTTKSSNKNNKKRRPTSFDQAIVPPITLSNNQTSPPPPRSSVDDKATVPPHNKGGDSTPSSPSLSRVKQKVHLITHSAGGVTLTTTEPVSHSPSTTTGMAAMLAAYGSSESEDEYP